MIETLSVDFRNCYGIGSMVHDFKFNKGVKPEDLIVEGNQTGKWIDLYKKEAREDKNMGIIERVSMMTPEAIHINSFMFEPLIDMSLQHLLSLYNDCAEHLK